MIHVQKNIQLKSFNTFGIKAHARYFCVIHSEQDLEELIKLPVFKNEKRLFLGGGSNILFTKDFDGLIIKNELTGKAIVEQNEDRLLLNVKSGENWHELVMFCLRNDWGGIENLSLIPGTVGAAPIQNIGAYGVEMKDVIEHVEVIDVTSGKKTIVNNKECCFGYRESIFKTQLKEKYFISSVTLSLTKKNHQLNINYGAIKDTLLQQQVATITIQSISDAVVMIRKSKLPDPSLIGNAGSFFKNPTLTRDEFTRIQKIDTSMPYYTTENQSVKIPAGWLIEQCGWKGKRINNIGVHQHQALVLVNYGDGNGEDVFELSTQIASSVKDKFDIILSTEVNIV